MKRRFPQDRKWRSGRTNDPEGNRRNIIAVATREFADKGFSGARVDAIAARTKSSKRMIYYYFGGKEGLYIAVLRRHTDVFAALRPRSIWRISPLRRHCAPWSSPLLTIKTLIRNSSGW